MAKKIDLYLDWQDTTTYVGVGVIISRVNNLPVVCLDTDCYQPKRCLVEIIESIYYPTGFRKHFIVPHIVTQREAWILNRKIDRSKSLIFNMWDEIMLRNNPIVDTPEEIKLREDFIEIQRKYLYSNKPIPQNIVKSLEKRFKKYEKKRNDLLSK